MTEGYYTSFTTYRCSVCNKFFTNAGYHWTPHVHCPHCNIDLAPEPYPDDFIMASGCSVGGLIFDVFVGTGIPPSGLYAMSGVY